MVFGFLRRRKEPFAFVPDPLPRINNNDELIKKMDEVEKSIKEHVTAEIGKVSAQLGETFAKEIGQILTKLDTIPPETRKEIEAILVMMPKARTPFAVRTMTAEVSKKVTGALSDVIDSALVKVIAEKGKITTAELLRVSRERGICSRASVFRHLQQLEHKGKVRKITEGRAVVYLLPESQPQDIPSITSPEIQNTPSETSQKPQ